MGVRDMGYVCILLMSVYIVETGDPGSTENVQGL
jgi:hypothetical protein